MWSLLHVQLRACIMQLPDQIQTHLIAAQSVTIWPQLHPTIHPASEIVQALLFWTLSAHSGMHLQAVYRICMRHASRS
jgi:hypothetical protein